MIIAHNLQEGLTSWRTEIWDITYEMQKSEEGIKGDRERHIYTERLKSSLEYPSTQKVIASSKSPLASRPRRMHPDEVLIRERPLKRRGTSFHAPP